MRMTLRNCPRHPEIKSLLGRGHWPAAATPDLLSHAETCQSCAQLVLLTQAFRQDRAHAHVQAAPRLEAPGVLWWRAQLRRRNSAIERLQRPLIGAQIFAVTLSLMAAAAFLAWQSKQGLGWLADFPKSLHFDSLHFETLLPTALQTPLGLTALITAVLAVLALLSGALAYATSEKR
jgi:hypothetical protein